MRRGPSAIAFATAVVLALVASVHFAGRAGAAAANAELRVFAAASLADAFKDLAQQFGKAQPGTHVVLNLAGSQQLVAQMEQGAAADVFASADTRWMDEGRDRGYVADSATVFARNRLVVIVPKTNPARIDRLQDLTKPGIKLVIGAEAVPVGKYSREMLRNLSNAPGFAPDYARRVLANVVSEEENVKNVAGKVQLGEADAGIVYRSDVTPSLAHFVSIMEIPDSANVVASYPIAVVKGARNAAGAQAFVALVLSPAGQRTLARHGLIPIARP